MHKRPTHFYNCQFFYLLNGCCAPAEFKKISLTAYFYDCHTVFSPLSAYRPQYTNNISINNMVMVGVDTSSLQMDSRPNYCTCAVTDIEMIDCQHNLLI